MSTLYLEKALTSSNIKAGFRESGILPLIPQAITNKMKPSRTSKPMDIEVKEYME